MPSARLLLLAFLPAVTGCVVIPIGDLLKGPALGEQILTEGRGIFAKDKVAVIEIEGMIRGDESSHLLLAHENTVAETRSRFDMVRADPEVKAVVLKIASPGGEVTACDVIHQELLRFKAEKKVPVVACILDHGTSGAYYIAVAADSVIAHPTSVIGSIGVLLDHFDLSGLLEKIGVGVSPIKSGEKKDLNSLFRPMTADEHQLLQKLVNDMYERFVTVVDEGRPALNKDEVRALADGRVVSGVEAASLKLVDGLGYLPDAITVAAKAAGIESPTIVHYTRIARSGANIYSQGMPGSPTAGDVNLNVTARLFSTPMLYYLWRPGF